MLTTSWPRADDYARYNTTSSRDDDIISSGEVLPKSQTQPDERLPLPSFAKISNGHADFPR